MDVTPLIPQGRQIIQGYGPEGFRVSGKTYERAVVVMPDETREWAAPATFEDMNGEHLATLADLMSDSGRIELVLFGCGARSAFLTPDKRDFFKKRGLNADTMDTGAACRTYNVLMAEGRQVAATLFPIGAKN